MPAPSRRDLVRLDLLNAGLMLGSAALAWVVPFEMFLASYAVLGPLHYLTQLSWLHERGFATTGRRDWIPLALLALLSLDAVSTRWVPWTGAAFVALAAGVAAAFVASAVQKLAVLVLAVAVAAPLHRWEPAAVLFAGLLPTVVHVYIFTGLFLLAGTLKGRRASGWLSLAVFAACGPALLLLRPDGAAAAPHPRVLAALDPFTGLFAALAPASGRGPEALLAAGRFLAFAYTYHYLNWFSKTRVIRWHAVPRARLAALALLWLASVALYAYDYALGLLVLFALSMAHVFLEFPLDARTLVAVVRELRGSPAGGTRPVATASAADGARAAPRVGRAR